MIQGLAFYSLQAGLPTNYGSQCTLKLKKLVQKKKLKLNFLNKCLKCTFIQVLGRHICLLDNLLITILLSKVIF